MYYSIAGKNITLIPLYEEKGLFLLARLCEKRDFRESSLLFSDELNFSDSMYVFGRHKPDDEFWTKQRLYVAAVADGSDAYGIIGLKDIDWLQRRAEVVIIITDDASKKKIAYEPLKLLLAKAVKDWQMRRMWARLRASDTQTTTVLKGFGFAVEGKLREDIRIESGHVDVSLLGLLDREFRTVENV
jgi:RimJ/RimL family protein N-acetyltransferase